MILTLQLLKEVSKLQSFFYLLFYREWELCYMSHPKEGLPFLVFDSHGRRAEIGLIGSHFINRRDQK